MEKSSSREPRKSPIRTCVACRMSSDKRTLLRIVRTSEGAVSFDGSGKAPGRGAYVCPTKDCIASAIKHKRLGRALRCDIPESLILDLETIVVNNDAEH